MRLWENEGTCRVCKRTFKRTYGVRHIYCSRACRQKAYRERVITKRRAARRARQHTPV